MDRCWKNHAAVEIPDEERREAAGVAAEAATARCDAESDEAEKKASEAEAAAARCVKARDNAVETPTVEEARRAAAEAEEARRAAAVAAALKAADECDAACVEAAAKTSAAEEAAARCVAARDNAVAVELVSHASRARVCHTTLSSFRQARARCHTVATASRKAYAAHDDARSVAKAAALAAREASIRCAAASRDAAAAALADQEAADLCVPVLADAATEEARAAAAGLALQRVDAVAAAATRQAAADVAGKRADAAALAARQAAASCDAALADPEADEDKKFLDSMRGWLMTVAALLVNMTFSAIIKPPSWVPLDFGFDIIFHLKAASSPGPAPAPAPAVDTIKSNVSVWVSPAGMAIIYLMVNAVTFASAITLVVSLVKMEKGASAKGLIVVRNMMRFLALGAAGSFATGTSQDMRVVLIVFGVIAAYVFPVLRAVFRHSGQR